MSTLTHDELRDLVPIYALDALGGTEALEMRGHLESCTACQEALGAYLTSAGNLAMTAEPVVPPPALRARLLDAIGTLQQETLQQDPPVVQEAPIKPVAPVLQPRKGRGWGPGWNWERVTAIVAVAALLVVGAFSLALVQRIRSQQSQQQQFVQALGGQAAKAIALQPTGAGNGVTAQVLVGASGTSGALVVKGLADPGSKVYKVWTIVDSKAVGVSTFRPDASGTALVAINSGSLSSMSGMAVTLESDPNVAAPQGPRVLQTA